MKRMHFQRSRHFWLVMAHRSRSHLYRGCRRIALFLFAVTWFLTIIAWVSLHRKNSPYQEMIFQHQDLLAQLQRLKASCQTRQLEVDKLSSLFAALLNSSVMRRAMNSSHLSREERLVLRNLTDMKVNRETRSLPSLRLPSIYFFMPHLQKTPKIQPAHYISQGRSGVSIVLGIPTVKREVKSYLVATLRNLIDNMTPKEVEDVLIVVLIAETDSEYVLQVFEELEEHFLEQLETGLLDIISPPASYYPDMQSLRLTLGDNYTRVQWRSKQSLDYAFLMMYAQDKGIYYIQLEDDVMTKKNFINMMKVRYFAFDRISRKRRLFLISFSKLGFIGEMMKSAQLPLLIEFLLLFYNDQPVDWSMLKLTRAITCPNSTYSTPCSNEHHYVQDVHITPPLFQHIGLYSSLKGKVQPLKENKF